MTSTTRAAGAAVALAIAIMLVDIGLVRLGYGLLLPAIRADLGGSYGVYGAIGAVHLAGYLGGTLIAARIIRDRALLPRLTAVAQAVVGLALIWSVRADGAVALGLARAVAGLASGVAVAAAITDALERVSPARRGTAGVLAFAGIGAALVLSAPSGPWALAEVTRWRWATAAWAAAALVTALGAFALRPYAPAVARGADRPFVLRDLATSRWAWFAGAYGGFGVAYIAFATFAPAAFAAAGIRGAGLAAMWAAFGAASMLGAWATTIVLAGRLRRWALALPLVTGVAGCAVSLQASVVAAVCGACLVGFGLASVPGVVSAFARDRSDAATAARAFAAVTTCFGVGQLLGPPVAGALADRFGPASVSSFAGAVFACAAACAALDAAQQTRAHVEDAAA